MPDETLADLLNSVGLRPAWERTREARPGYQQQQSPAGALADPRTLPYRRIPTRRDREFSRASLADTAQRGAWSEPRNQIAEAGMNVLETTGAPSFARGVRSLQANEPGRAAGEFAMGGLGLLGTASLPFGGGARAAPPRIPRIQQAMPEAHGIPDAPPRLPGRATDGSVLPMRPREPIRQSLVGGSDDLREAARSGLDAGPARGGRYFRGVRSGDAMDGEGPIYLHRDPQAASEFAGARFGSDGRPLIEMTGEGGNVAPVIADFKNPASVTQQEIASLGYEPWAVNRLKEQGYDAAVAPNGEVLVFDRTVVRPELENPTRARPDGGSAREGFDTGRVVYRGLGRPYNAADGGYYQSFTSSLADAQEYGSNVVAAHIRPGRNLAIEGGGNNFNSLSVHQLPEDVRSRLHPSVGGAATTDQIAHAAREAGYDSVTVRNVHDNRWGERPVSGASPRTIDFVFNTENISPLDNIPPQAAETLGGNGATLANARARLSDADRALLAELEDFPDSTGPNAGPPRPPMFPGGRNR